MDAEIVKVDPNEYGLEKANASKIEEAFLPMITEREELRVEYAKIVALEDSEENSILAKELGKKLVKVRTGIAAIHKTQKQFFWSAGKFVDAWKNAETLPVEQMEEKLKEKAQFAERLAAERKQKLQDERVALALVHDPDAADTDFASMTEKKWEEIYENLVWLGERRKQKEEEEEKARLAEEKAEADRLAKEKAEQKAKDVELAKLKKEADERDAKEAEAQKIRDAEAKKLDDERKAKEKAHNAEIAANQKKLAEAKAEADRLEADAKAKADAEAKAKADQDAREKDKNHRKAINNGILEVIKGKCVTDEAAKELIKLIATGKIPNVTINY